MKEKLDARTGADTTVEADADKLLATITLDVSKIVGVDMKDIRAFLDKWLPAHLRYRVILLIESGYISPEKYTVTGMALGYEAQFWPVRTLNGAWLLDGTYNLDAVRKADEYGLNHYNATMHVVKGFGAIPSEEIEGTSATGYCDHTWVNATITAVSLRFGYCSDGLDGGLWARTLNRGAAYAGWGYGASFFYQF